MKVKGFLAVLLFAALLVSGFACGGGGAPAETPTPTAVGESAEEIAEAAMAAGAELDTCQFDMYMNMTMVGEMSGTMTVDAEGAIDEPNEKMCMDMDMTMEAPGEEEMEMSMEMYIVEGWMYMGMDIPGMPAMWMKAPMTEDMWEEQDIASQQLDLLRDFVEVELLGTEIVSGVDCYKLQVTPDLEKLWAWAQMQEGIEEDLPPGFDFEEIFTDLSITVWVAKDTYFTVKSTVDMTMTIESDTIDMTMTMLMYGFNEPVTIQLPPEAADAVEVPMP